MDEIQIYASATVAILGIAYPILLQVISRLDEKYDSDYIVELFEKEWIRKLFIFSLVASLVSIFLWTMKWPALILKDFNIVQNSTAILVITTTVLLIFVFFRFVNKVIVYYTPQKIVTYFIKKHERSPKNEQKLEDLKYFNALSNIFLVSIKRHQSNISKKLSQFFYGEFRKVREMYKNQPVEYPQQFYNLVYNSVEELALQKEMRNQTLEQSIGGGIWLIGALDEGRISERTYRWLWQNLRVAVLHGNDEILVFHWENAVQYFSYNLSKISPVFDSRPDIGSELYNNEEIELRGFEREKFIEFHYALGGLLIFSKRFECLSRMFEHTDHTPPKYVLLPDSMDQIFNFFFKIRNDFNREYVWISSMYSFPRLNGLNADGVIKRWISSYMTILFLRQYTLHAYFTYMRPMDLPQLPPTQGEKKEWIEGLEFFKKLLEGNLEDIEMLKSLGLDFITEKWCEKNGKKYPIEFIEELKKHLVEEYDYGALTLPIAPEKKKQFFNSSKKIIEPAIESAMRINNASPLTGNVDKRYVIGERMLQSKDPFSENPEASHGNYDSILAEVISRKINDGLGSTFFLKLAITYLLPPDSIFDAIDELTKVNKEEFMIVNFGLRITYYMESLNIKRLTEESYKGIPIINFNGGRTVNRSLFVLKRIDFPEIIPLQIDAEVVEKYKLDPISEKFNVLGSVIDLYQENDIRKEFTGQDKSDEELQKSVLVSIYLSLEVKWKKGAKVVELSEHSLWEEQGIAHELKDIVPFNQI